MDGQASDVGASVAYTVYLLATGVFWPLRYNPAAAASLPFSLGAAMYYWREPLLGALQAMSTRLAETLSGIGLKLDAERVLQVQAVLACAVFVTHALFADRLWGDPMNFGFYVSLLLSAYLLLVLTAVDTERLAPALVRLDGALGNLSYCVFLCHWMVAYFVVWFVFDSARPGGSALFWYSVVPLNLVAYGIHAGVERPVFLIPPR